MIYAIFLCIIAFLLVLDLGVFNKKQVEPSLLGSSLWTMFWISLALLFGGFVYAFYDGMVALPGIAPAPGLSGSEAFLKYVTGFVIEKSLSLDNIFVIALIFSFFKVAPKYQHRILFYGVAGAIVFRGLMVFAGVALLERFSWLTYLFGAILLYSALQFLVSRQEDMDFYSNPVLKFLQKRFEIDYEYEGSAFYIVKEGRKVLTRTFLVVAVVELSDIMFAFDSVPAIFAITTDPFLVFTSNIFAIMGLRSLYFVLVALIERFRYLKQCLAFILIFVGIKMMIIHYYKMPAEISLAFVLGTLIIGVIASLIAGKDDPAKLSMGDNAPDVK